MPACVHRMADLLTALNYGPAAQIGVIYGNPEVTSGGNALKFYASVRLEVRRKMTHESAKGESTGIRVKAKVGGGGGAYFMRGHQINRTGAPALVYHCL